MIISSRSFKSFDETKKTFTLDGEPLTEPGTWAWENGLFLGLLEDMSLLGVGDTMLVGGGAGATFTLRREA
jgi:hypothetical protein